jgi:hypothetical protein
MPLRLPTHSALQRRKSELFECSDFSLPDAPAPTDAFRTLAAEVGTTTMSGNRPINFAEMPTSMVHLVIFYMPQIRDIGPAALLPFWRKACLRIFLPLKIRRLRPGLNPRTWVPETSTLTPRPPKPLCHRCTSVLLCGVIMHRFVDGGQYNTCLPRQFDTCPLLVCIRPCPHTHTTWTLSAAVIGWLTPGLFSPLYLPPLEMNATFRQQDNAAQLVYR